MSDEAWSDAHSGELKAEFRQRPRQCLQCPGTPWTGLVNSAHPDRDTGTPQYCPACGWMPLTVIAVKSPDGWQDASADDSQAALMSTNAEILQLRSALEEACRAAVQAPEDERRRLGRELHDGVAQIITSAIFSIDRCVAGYSRLPTPVYAEFGQVRALLESTLFEIRQIVSDLRPQVIDRHGLIEAVRWYAHRWSAQTGIPVDLEVDEALPELSAQAEHSAFRILQEALSNILKHACAQRVWVAVTADQTTAWLRIRDDGVGISSTSAPLELSGLTGIGRHSMAECAALIGAEFRLTSALGRGTEISVHIPSLLSSTRTSALSRNSSHLE